jgi:hypothetical protein
MLIIVGMFWQVGLNLLPELRGSRNAPVLLGRLLRKPRVTSCANRIYNCYSYMFAIDGVPQVAWD